MSKTTSKIKCLIIGHEWQFKSSVYGATTISKGRTVEDFKGNTYKCRRCGKLDKV